MCYRWERRQPLLAEGISGCSREVKCSGVGLEGQEACTCTAICRLGRREESELFVHLCSLTDMSNVDLLTRVRRAA